MSGRSWPAQAREVELAEPGGRSAGRRRARDRCGAVRTPGPATRRGQEARGDTRQEAGQGGSCAGMDACASSAGASFPPGAGKRSRGSGRAAGVKERTNAGLPGATRAERYRDVATTPPQRGAGGRIQSSGPGRRAEFGQGAGTPARTGHAGQTRPEGRTPGCQPSQAARGVCARPGDRFGQRAPPEVADRAELMPGKRKAGERSGAQLPAFRAAGRWRRGCAPCPQAASGGAQRRSFPRGQLPPGGGRGGRSKQGRAGSLPDGTSGPSQVTPIPGRLPDTTPPSGGQGVEWNLQAVTDP